MRVSDLLHLRRRFTLIELLVVIAIIAILAAILMPALQQARERANATKCISNLKNCSLAADMYRADFRDFWPQSYNTTLYPAWVTSLMRGKYFPESTQGSGFPDLARCPSLSQVKNQFEAYGSIYWNTAEQIGFDLKEAHWYKARTLDQYPNPFFDLSPSQLVLIGDSYCPEEYASPRLIFNPLSGSASSTQGRLYATHGGRANIATWGGNVISVAGPEISQYYHPHVNSTLPRGRSIQHYTPASEHYSVALW